MDNITSVKQFLNKIFEIEDKFWYGFAGFKDYSVKEGYGKPNYIYPLNKEDFTYNEQAKEIHFNIGNYINKKPKNLLERLFIPLDEMSFDLLEAIKKENITLIIENNNLGTNKDFCDTVRNFFTSLEYEPEYKGEW